MQALWMALGALFFSMMGVCIKLASPHFGTMEIVFFRGLTGMVMFAVLLGLRGVKLSTPVPMLHVRRNAAGVTAMSMWFYAIGHLPFATAMMFNNMSSVWLGALIVVVAWWRTGQLAYPKLFGAVLLGFGGVVLLLQPHQQGTALLPNVVGLASGVLSAVAYTQVKSLGEAGEPELRTVFYLSCGTALMGLAGTVLLHGGFSPLWHSNSWYLLGTGFFASLGQMGLTRAYTRAAALVVANLQYLGLVFSSLFGIWLFHDRLGWVNWLGMGVIVASGIAATMWRPKQPIVLSATAPVLET